VIFFNRFNQDIHSAHCPARLARVGLPECRGTDIPLYPKIVPCVPRIEPRKLPSPVPPMGWLFATEVHVPSCSVHDADRAAPGTGDPRSVARTSATQKGGRLLSGSRECSLSDVNWREPAVDGADILRPFTILSGSTRSVRPAPRRTSRGGRCHTQMRLPPEIDADCLVFSTIWLRLRQSVAALITTLRESTITKRDSRNRSFVHVLRAACRYKHRTSRNPRNQGPLPRDPRRSAGDERRDRSGWIWPG